MPTYIAYTLYDPTTGEVNAYGQTDADNPVSAPPGLAVHLGGGYPRATHYFAGDVPTPYTQPQIDARAVPLYAGAVWSNTTMSWIEARTLAQAKADKRQELAGAWQTAMQAGVTVGGKVAPTTPDAWTDYLTLKAMAADADWVDTPIQLVDGSFELLTQAKAAALWTALKAHRRTTTARLRDRVDSVNAAATVAAVVAIVW